MLSTEFRHDDVPLSQPPATHWGSSSAGLPQFWSSISIVSKSVLSSEAVHILPKVREVDRLFWRGGRLTLIEVSSAANIIDERGLKKRAVVNYSMTHTARKSVSEAVLSQLLYQLKLSFAVLFSEKAENFSSFDQAFQNTRSAVREGEKLISMATNKTSAEGT